MVGMKGAAPAALTVPPVLPCRSPSALGFVIPVVIFPPASKHQLLCLAPRETQNKEDARMQAAQLAIIISVFHL